MRNDHERLKRALLHEMPESLKLKINACLQQENITAEAYQALIGELRARKTLTSPREAINWYPSINHAACTRCDLCISNCPKGVYAYDGDKIVVREPYNCVLLCSKCMRQCPYGAITFPDKNEYRHYIVYI